MKAQATINGELYTVNDDFSVTFSIGTIPADNMREYAEMFKGVNRIYKPYVILFWTDVKNGKAKNWVNQ